MKHIYKSDIENLELKSLPIRRGCNAGSMGCACIGSCKEIVGYIDRDCADEILALLNNPRDEYELGRKQSYQNYSNSVNSYLSFLEKLIIEKKEMYGQYSYGNIEGQIMAFKHMVDLLKYNA